MIPDEEPKAASEPSPAEPARVRRRSRRGGRRHSGRRRPPNREGGVEPSAAAEPAGAPPAAAEPTMPAAEYESEPIRETAQPATPARVSDAIVEVTEIIEELKRVLNEMEDVLETLELAERQKIDDEREIESLQRALRQLHRPHGGSASQRH